MANTIDPSLMLANYQKPERQTGNDILGKDDFLKILMVQLQNQDPTNPLQDKDFIAQMATFSSLEQMTNMSKSMDKFVQMQEQNTIVSYSQFVGKEVTWHKLDETQDPTSEDAVQTGTGVIDSVKFVNNSVVFVMEDGSTLEPANISEVNSSSRTNSMLESSMLIGKTVNYLDDAGNEAAAVVKAVSFKDGKTMFHLDNDASIAAKQISRIE
ncbi:flagellar hook assembly protein FlgD [Bacillus infantis]|uniref:flagellar hook assembly protein FlgD n=1 Tax=Bacillus infantis TaxID=324767 RepID=UPI000B9A625B|nr:flagellar hook assembly protein FlgD [Bacillus infantis]MCK6206204.1 flagellar hook assembly protein FlgD [Bacillus infantis]OXT18652.1 flagellar hook assembly protein FlgD [Bacillus sp. OG2]